MEKKNSHRKLVLSIDESPVYGHGMSRILSQNAEFEFLGQVETIDAALNLPGDEPEIIALDLSVAKCQGIAAIKELLCRYPSAAVLILTAHDEVLFAERCLKAGARGYLMKTSAPAQVIEALGDVALGNLHVSELLRSQMLQRLSGKSGVGFASEFDRLSDRELLIVQHIGQSKNNKEIAHELQISVKTIESHRSRIKAKLRLTSPNELVRYALKLQNANF